MTYPQAILFLYDLQLAGLKFGLENTRLLAAWAGNPEKKLRFIHVAGTNGKGSTCAMLESVYRAAGLKVGLYTSPHLISFAERIQVNRVPITAENLVRLVKNFQTAPMFTIGNAQRPTFFEATTVLALQYFAEQGCDLVIWETGLGGRLDATNIVQPLASVITNVQLDHQQWLGQTIAAIAREKAGIVKKDTPIVTSAVDPVVLEIIAERAEELDAPLTIVTARQILDMAGFDLDLKGDHQLANAALTRATIDLLKSSIPISDEQLIAGLKNVQWPGRWQKISLGNGQTIILDGAHNPAGAQTVAKSWHAELAGADAALILGAMSDKDSEEICRTLAPLSQDIILTRLASERSADPATLAQFCRLANPSATVNVSATIAEALAWVASHPTVVVTGSLYLVGEALEHLTVKQIFDERGLNEYGSAPIEAVTFDIGGTLIEPWPSVGTVYASVAKRHGLELAPNLLDERFIAAWRRRKNFSYSTHEWSSLVDDVFEGLTALRPSQSFFTELYQEFARADAWRVFDDVIPTLQRLRARGIKLAAVSNWDTRLRPLLSALKLEQYFDVILVSGEVGHHKPSPEIFRRAAADLGFAPPSILHVGDSRSEDFDGARAAGFRSLLLDRRATTVSANIITSLEGVLAIR